MGKEVAMRKKDDTPLSDRIDMLCGTSMVVKGTPFLRLEIAGSAMQSKLLNAQQNIQLSNVATSRPSSVLSWQYWGQ